MNLDHPMFLEVTNLGQIFAKFAAELHGMYEKQGYEDNKMITILNKEYEKDSKMKLNELCTLERLLKTEKEIIKAKQKTREEKCKNAKKKHEEVDNKYKEIQEEFKILKKTNPEKQPTAELLSHGSKRKEHWKIYKQCETQVNILNKQLDTKENNLKKVMQQKETFSSVDEKTQLKIEIDSLIFIHHNLEEKTARNSSDEKELNHLYWVIQYKHRESLLHRVEDELYHKIGVSESEEWLNKVDEEVRQAYAKYREDKHIRRICYWMFRAVRNSKEHYINHRNNPNYDKALEKVGPEELSFLTYMINTYEDLVPATIEFIMQNKDLLPETHKTLRHYCPRITKPVFNTFDTLARNMIDAVFNQLYTEKLICQFDTSNESLLLGYTAFIRASTQHAFPQPHIKIVIEIKAGKLHFDDGIYNWDADVSEKKSIRIVEARNIKRENFVHAENAIYIVADSTLRQQCQDMFLDWCRMEKINVMERSRKWSDLNQETQIKLKDKLLMVTGKPRRFSDVFLDKSHILFGAIEQIVNDNLLQRLIEDEELDLLRQTVTLPEHYILNPINLASSTRINILYGRPLIGKSLALKCLQKDTHTKDLLYTFNFNRKETGFMGLTIKDISQYFLPEFKRGHEPDLECFLHLVHTSSSMVIIIDGVENLFCENEKRIEEEECFKKCIEYLRSLPVDNPTKLWIVTRSSAKRKIKSMLMAETNTMEFLHPDICNFKSYMSQHLAKNKRTGIITDMEMQKVENILKYLADNFSNNPFLCSVATEELLYKDVAIDKYQLSKLLAKSYFKKSICETSVNYYGYTDNLRKIFLLKHIIFAFNALYLVLSKSENFTKVQNHLPTLKYDIYTAVNVTNLKSNYIDYGLLRLENTQEVQWDDMVPFYEQTMCNYFLALCFLETYNVTDNRVDDHFRARAEIFRFITANSVKMESFDGEEIEYYVEMLGKEENYEKVYNKLLRISSGNWNVARSNKQLSSSY